MSGPAVPIRTSPPAFAYLIVAGGPQAGAIFQLTDEVATVGRGGDNAVRLDDPAVSVEHLRVRRDGDQFTLVDRGSENGAQVNGRRVEQHLLRHNDVIEVGRTPLVFKQLAGGR